MSLCGVNFQKLLLEWREWKTPHTPPERKTQQCALPIRGYQPPKTGAPIARPFLPLYLPCMPCLGGRWNKRAKADLIFCLHKRFPIEKMDCHLPRWGMLREMFYFWGGRNREFSLGRWITISQPSGDVDETAV